MPPFPFTRPRSARATAAAFCLLLLLVAGLAPIAAGDDTGAKQPTDADTNGAAGSANVDAVRGLALLVALAMGALLFGGNAGVVLPPRTPAGRAQAQMW